MTQSGAPVWPGTFPGRAAARALATAAVLCVGLIAAPANGQVQGTWTRSPAQAWPGEHIDVAGNGCIENGKPYEGAYVKLFLKVGQSGNPFIRYHDYNIAANGQWGGLFPIPSDAPPGQYRFTAACTASDMVMAYQEEYDFTVLGAPPSPTKSPTPSRTPTRPAKPPRPPTPTPTPTSHRPSPSPTTAAPTDDLTSDPTASATATPSTAAVPRSDNDRPVGWLALGGALATAVGVGAFRLRRG